MALGRGLQTLRPRRNGGWLLSAALVVLLVPVSELAARQVGSVQGTVVDEGSLQPLATAQVSVPGTGFTTLTDAQGAYDLAGIPAGGVELRVERLGYATETREVELQAGEIVTEDFQLQLAAIALDELLVTATGVQRRRELGNATSIIRAADEVERVLPTSVTSLLQGRASGMQVLQASGTVGGSGSIKIRGNTSISMDNTPLVYVDGARISRSMVSGPGVGGQTTSRLNDLNPDEIESIEIVKGPSAATLYGTEAAAGVIRITTKRGRTGTNEWTYRSELGSNWDDTDWPATVWNPRALLGEELDISELFAPGTIPPGESVVSIPDTLYSMNLLRDGRAGEEAYGTPWRSGLEHTQSASLRGGMDQVTYYLSAELSQREGSLPNNEATRRNVRGNFSFTPSPNVDIAVSTGFSSTEALMPDNDNNGFGYIGVAQVGSPGDMQLRRSDPALGGGEVITCPLAFELQRALLAAGIPITLSELAGFCSDNPFFSQRTFENVRTLRNQENIERFIGSTTIDYRPLDFLTARGTVGYDQYSNQTGAFVPVDLDRPFDELSRGFRSIGHSVIRNLTMEADLTARFQLTPALRSTTSVGGQFFRAKGESASSSGRFLPAGTETVSNAVRTEGGEGVSETRTIGLYAQQELSVHDRLFLTPALRVDQNSAFGERLGWEAYPRIMGSYVISEEEWFPDLFMDVESFRLRAAWGMSGKQPSSFAALQLLAAQRVAFLAQDVPGVRLTRPANPDLSPERGHEIELGFDADVLGGRLGVDFTWYHQTTRDAIVSRDLAPSTGFSSPQPTNIGEIQSRGVELGLNALLVNEQDVRWSWQLNLGTQKGEVIRLEDPIPFGIDGVNQRHQEGRPYAAYWSRTYEIQGGELVVSDTAQFVGHPTPEWEGSLSSSVTLFDRVTLHANLGFAGGHQQYNGSEQFRCAWFGGGEYGGLCPELFEENANGERTDDARRKGAAATDGQFHPWIEDATFARLRSVSARFDFPARWAQWIGASRASFTLSGENLALFTGYGGLDPEVNFAGGSQSTRGEFLTLPPARRMTGRFSITF